MKINSFECSAVLDSNGRGALEITLGLTDDNLKVRAIAPRGSTTGDFEATFFEDPHVSGLESAEPAVASANALLPSALVGQNFETLRDFDAALTQLDPSPQFNLLGGNVAIAASFAFAKGLAATCGVHLHRVLSDAEVKRFPLPMFNIIDGAPIAGSGIGGVEFLLIPHLETNVARAIQMGIDVRNATRKLLSRQNIVAGDSPQGALLLASADCEFPLATILEAAADAGYKPGLDFTLGLDLAASDYYHDETGCYTYPWPALNTLNAADRSQTLNALCAEYQRLTSNFHLSFIEDGFAEVDTEGWRTFASQRGKTLMIADDLCASNPVRIDNADEEGLIQGVLIKPNQIGTLTGAIEALRVANTLGLLSIVSQRSGENDDDVITHLAIAGRADYLKFGGPARMDRIIKLNSLLKCAREAALIAS